MKVKFEADYKDFAETSYHLWKNKKSSAEILFPYFISSVCFAGISSIPAFIFSNSKWAGGLTFFIIFLLSMYLHRIPNKSHFFNEFRKKLGNKLYEIEIEFTDQGIHTRQLGNEYIYGWENLSQVQETDDRFFFFLTQGNGLSIPLRAFEHPTQIGQFVAFAKSRLPAENLISE